MNRAVCVEELTVAPSTSPTLGWSLTPSLFKNWCGTELQWVMNEPFNSPRLWDQVARHVRRYLGVLWVTGALKGARPREAFRVTCDQTTMTDREIDAGHVVCQVGLAADRPSEFIYYRIRIRLQPIHKPLAVA